MSQKHRLLSASWQHFLIWMAGTALGSNGAPGPVVRSVRFDRQPIFSAEERARIPWLPLGFVDRLHLDTRTSVVSRELVFKSGERLPDGALEESERKLRGTGFFGEVSVEAVPVAPDSIDVVVRTREVWTTELSASYERFEGQLLWAASLRERNFLGLAKAIDVSRAQNDDRSTWSVGFADRQMLDGTWRGSIGVSESNDGAATAWVMERPFFRLGSGWGGDLRYAHVGQGPRFYLDSDTYVRPQIDLTQLDAVVLHRIQESPTAVWRLGLGVRGFSQRVSPQSDLTLFESAGGKTRKAPLTDSGSESRTERTVSIQLRRVTKRYAELRYINAMGQVEDFALGGESAISLGWATHSFGGSVSGLRLGGAQNLTDRFGAHLVSAQVRSDGLVTSDKAVDLWLSGQVDTHLSFGHGLRLATHAFAATSSGLDRHRAFTLGIENGLRAATYREFAGDRLFRCNLELRWVHEPGLLRLITPGLTGFMDIGSAWYEREQDLRWNDLRGAIGLGLRIGFRQGSQFVPLRFDLAWPMLYDIDRQSPVLSIGTGQVF